MLRAGRGFGKTRTGAEWVHKKAREMPRSRGAIIGRTLKDAKRIMVKGPSGIMNTAPPHLRPKWWPGNYLLKWPNGTEAEVLTAEKPGVFRGRQYDWVWGDEFAHWTYIREAHDNIVMGTRMGEAPQVLYTSTPLSLNIIRELEAQDNCAVTVASMYENAANLAAPFLNEMKKYEGTELGRQELHAELLDGLAGALWTKASINEIRVSQMYVPIVRALTIVDPAVSKRARSNKSAIVTSLLGADGRVYWAQEDVDKFAAEKWPGLAVQRARYWNADLGVETNQGGDLAITAVKAACLDEGWRPRLIEIKSIREKGARAIPVAVASNGDKLRVIGHLPKTESDMTTFVPGVEDPENSPDGLDAGCIGACILLGLTKDKFGRTLLTQKPVGL